MYESENFLLTLIQKWVKVDQLVNSKHESRNKSHQGGIQNTNYPNKKVSNFDIWICLGFLNLSGTGFDIRISNLKYATKNFKPKSSDSL